jgi:hypothetical protein
MKKLALSLVAALALAFAAVPVASACDDEKGHATTAANTKPQTVALEGKVVSVGCPMEAAKAECTGAALVVGETKHPIKTARKGKELASKARDTDKVVKVTGTTSGEYLTVASYQIKG